MRVSINLARYAPRINDLATLPADDLHAIYIGLIHEIIITRGQTPMIHWL